MLIKNLFRTFEVGEFSLLKEWLSPASGGMVPRWGLRCLAEKFCPPLGLGLTHFGSGVLYLCRNSYNDCDRIGLWGGTGA